MKQILVSNYSVITYIVWDALRQDQCILRQSEVPCLRHVRDWFRGLKLDTRIYFKVLLPQRGGVAAFDNHVVCTRRAWLEDYRPERGLKN